MPSAHYSIITAWTDKGMLQFDISPKTSTDMKKLLSASWNKSTWIQIFSIKEQSWSSLKDQPQTSNSSTPPVGPPPTDKNSPDSDHDNSMTQTDTDMQPDEDLSNNGFGPSQPLPPGLEAAPNQQNVNSDGVISNEGDGHNDFSMGNDGPDDVSPPRPPNLPDFSNMSPINNTTESIQTPTNVGNLEHFEQYDIAGDDSDRINIDDNSMSPASPAQAAVSPAQAVELDRSRSRSFNRRKAGSRNVSPSVKERIKKWDNPDEQDAAASSNDNDAKKSHGDGGVPI